MSSQEAVKFLELEETGEYVVRPSSRGLQQLTLTMKFFDQVFWHVDVLEEGDKPSGDAKLAPPLNIMGDRYEDLDDIMFNFVNPVRGYIAMVRSSGSSTLSTSAAGSSLLATVCCFLALCFCRSKPIESLFL